MPNGPNPNMVTSPPHYKDAARVECITVIEDLGLDFPLGNALKYLWRAGRKDSAKTLQDLEKARFYVDRAIARRGGATWNPDPQAAIGGPCIKGGCLQLNGHPGECDS